MIRRPPISSSFSARLHRLACWPVTAALACAGVLACLAPAPAAIAGTEAVLSSSASDPTGGAGSGQGPQTGVANRQGASAMLEQCVTALDASERSATFAGEMTTIAGAARMEIRIDLLERSGDEVHYHTVSAPGLGVWRGSDPGVKIYTYIKQVTNLSAPAFYRGAVRFRWLDSKGRLIKAEELRTPRCQQPAAPAATS